MPEIKFIAAIDEELGIAKKGKIPWDIPSDKKFFRESIQTHDGITGWKTFQRNNFKPYAPGRNNYVVTRRKEKIHDVVVVNDLQKFIQENEDDLWVIGGGEIFSQLLPYATKLYITQVAGVYGCDVFFPEFEDLFEMAEASEWQTENGFEFQYQIWTRLK